MRGQASDGTHAVFHCGSPSPLSRLPFRSADKRLMWARVASATPPECEDRSGDESEPKDRLTSKSAADYALRAKRIVERHHDLSHTDGSDDDAVD